jgi:hypothetical protein
MNDITFRVQVVKAGKKDLQVGFHNRKGQFLMGESSLETSISALAWVHMPDKGAFPLAH